MINEVKRAIFKLREIIDYDKKHRLVTIYDEEQIEFRNNIELVVDLVEKLQKENEELKGKNNKYENAEIFSLKQVDIIKEGVRQGTNEFVNENFIPKNKIRELLKGHNIEFAEDTIAMSEQGAFGFMLSIKELLEEE